MIDYHCVNGKLTSTYINAHKSRSPAHSEISKHMAAYYY